MAAFSCSAAAWPRNGALVPVPAQALGLSSRAAATLLPANAPAPFSGMGVAVPGGRAAWASTVPCTAAAAGGAGVGPIFLTIGARPSSQLADSSSILSPATSWAAPLPAESSPGLSGTLSLLGLGVVVPGGRAARALVRVQCTAGGDGDGDGEEPPKRFEYETFLLDLNKEDAKYRPIALFGSSDVLQAGYGSTAQESENLLLNILAGVPTNRLHNEGFVQLFTRAKAMAIGMAFRKVKAECLEGYVRADSLVAAMDALSLMAQKVPEPKIKLLPPYPIIVPQSSEHVNKALYFQDLMYAFDTLLVAVEWVFRGAYGTPFFKI